MSIQDGPSINVTFSCFNCHFLISEYEACQGDSGHNNYCSHINSPNRKSHKSGLDLAYIGYSNWTTPKWCPFYEKYIKYCKDEFGVKMYEK